jgi:UPF0755 protein
MDIRRIRPSGVPGKPKLTSDFKIPEKDAPEKPQEKLLELPAAEVGKPDQASSPEPATEPKKRSKFNKKSVVAIVLAIVFVAVASVATWVYILTSPPDSDGHARRVNIENGLRPKEIGQKLQKEGIIRSSFAFDMYTRTQGAGDQLQAGTYVLSPTQSLSEIVAYLAEGRIDPLRVTILPGSTIDDVTGSLVDNYGFAKSEVEAALKTQYDHPLFATKPKDASLEGYIFPETYEIGGNVSVNSLFENAFDVMWSRIQDGGLQRKLRAKGFNLHQAITLASVIERETNPDEKEQQQVSQIFQKRLKINMPLGADATFVYAAWQLGVTPSVDLQSPYNTRIHKGLPPGPISNFNLLALESVANPAKGNYIYFVHDDAGKIHYARTLAEHEENKTRYCGEKCALY